MNRAVALQLRGIGRTFGRHRVLDDVTLDVPPGSFIGLMGPNGAGKSTLIKILDGVYRPTEGEILVDGQPVADLGTHPGVGFVHQDLGLIDSLSIADNLFLGSSKEGRRGPFLSRAAEEAATDVALEAVGLDRSARTLVGDLAPGEKALVAVARVQHKGARLVVVDETTSTLPPADADRLVASLRAMTEDGATVIMVTHKLHEVVDVAERMVLLVEGRVAVDCPMATLDHAGLVRLMLREGGTVERDRGARSTPGRELLRLEQAAGRHAGPVDLVMYAGEVLGLTGRPGSGLHDIGLLVHGTIVPASGSVVRQPGVITALVPPHRESQGGFSEMSVRANLTISSLRRWVSRLGLLRPHLERDAADAAVAELAITPANPERHYGVLSGGNKQKVVFGRAVARQPHLYVLCEPTRGVDVATRRDIYALIERLAAEGAAVLVVSSDMEDLLAVCDRVAGVEGGRIGPLKPIDEFGLSELEEMV